MNGLMLCSLEKFWGMAMAFFLLGWISKKGNPGFLYIDG
jgi:hypothetical protein